MFEEYGHKIRKFYLYKNNFSFNIMGNELTLDFITKDLIEIYKNYVILYTDYNTGVTHKRIEIPIINLNSTHKLDVLGILYYLSKKYNIELMTVDSYYFDPLNIIIPIGIDDYKKYKDDINKHKINKIKKYNNILFIEFEELEPDDIINIINKIN